MADTTIDSLQIEINAKAQKANDAIDVLVDKLDVLSNSLGKLDASKISNFASGINQLSSSVKNIASIDGRTFTALANNLTKIANINSSGIGGSANAISSVASAFSQLQSVNQASQYMATLVSSISKLGNKSVTNAIVNIPQLANSMNQLMVTLSKAPTVNKSVIDMTNALANLAAQGSKVGSASKSVVNGLNRTNAAAKRASSSTMSLARAFGKFYANYFLLVRGFKGMFNMMESAMELTETVNYFEVTLRNIGESALENWNGIGKESAEEYSKSFAKQLRENTEMLTGLTISETGKIGESIYSGLGLNPAMVTQYSAMFAQVANSIGMTEQASVDLSKAFVRLGADWASLRNVDFEVAYEKLASGLSGQSRALRAFGVDITMATLQEIAFANGIEKSVSEMTQSEKAYLRLIAIIQQSKVAWGDLANTLDQPANMMRVLKQNIEVVSVLIGQVFLPIIQKALPIINGFTIAIRRMLIALLETMGVNTKDIINSTNGLDEQFGDMSDGIDEATESAEKFNRATRGWDELNVLGKDASKGYGVGNDLAENAELMKAYNDTIAEYDKAWNKAYEKINNEAEGFADRILSALNIWDKDKLYKGAENFGENIAEFLNNTITVENFRKIGDTVGTVLEAVIKSSISYQKNFDFGEAGRAVAEGLNDLFANLDGAELAEGLNDFVDGIFEGLKEAFANLDYEQIADFVADFFDELEIDTLTLLIGGITLKATGTTVGALLVNAIKKALPTSISLKGIILTISSFSVSSSPAFQMVGSEILSKISEWVKEHIPDWAYNLLSNIGAGIVGGAAAGSWFPGAGTIAGAIIGGIIGALKTEINGNEIWEVIVEKFFNFDMSTEVFNFANEMFADIDDAFKDKDWKRLGQDILAGVVTGFAAPFYFIAEPFVDFFEWVWDGICKIFGIHSPAKEMYPLGKNIALGVVEGFKGIKTDFYKVVNDWYNNFVVPWFSDKKWNFGGIGKGLQKAFNTAFEAIKGIWNGFAEWINKALNLNFKGFSKQFNVLGQSIDIGIPAFNVQLGKLPTFQTGGFPEDGLFMANHSELVGKFSNGKTAVANNDQITKGIEEAAYRGMIRALNQSNGRNSDVNVYLQGDAAGVFRLVQNENSRMKKVTGKSLLA